MVCKKCGTEIPEESIFCPKCGTKVDGEHSKKKRGKKGIAIGIIILVIVLGGGGYFALINSNPVSKYVHLFESDKSKEAIAVYNEKIEGNVDLEQKLSDEQNAEIEKIYKGFKDKKTKYDDAKEQLQKYTQYAPSKKYAPKYLDKLNSLNGSRTAYEDGKKAEKEGNIETAISKYKAVIEDDDSYTDAQKRIDNLKEEVKTELLNEAESYAQNKQYRSAIDNIDKAISVLGETDELVSLRKKYQDMKADEYAKVEVIGKSVTPKDSSNWIFSNYVDLVFNIQNNSNKTIKGIEGILIVSDLFDKEILRAECDFTGFTLNAGESYVERDLSYECNEFIDADMKFYNTDYSDLKFAYEISTIVYSDGTTAKPE